MMGKNSELKALWLAFIAYFTYYYNRKSVTLVFPQLIQEGLTQQDAGTIISSQSVAMALVTFGAGILSDRFPAKHMVCFGLLVCALSTLLFPTGTSVGQYSVYWFINGLGQGFSLPSLLKLTRENSTPTRFATNWSVVLISVNFAGVSNPFITAYLSQTYYWRTSVYISGVLTLLVASTCFIFLDSPGDSSEHGEKSDTSANNNKNKHDDGRWLDIIQHPLVLMCIISRFSVAVTRQGVGDWSQIYLVNEQHLDVYMSSTFISLVEIGGIFGKLIAGRISDILLRRAIAAGGPGAESDGQLKLAARLPVSIAMLSFSALALHLYCFHIKHNTSLPVLAVTALLLGINASGNVVNLSVIATEISPKRAGLCASLVNLSAK
ncbi:unnamed protein product, partial [Medioppia subpectinata]